MTSGTNLKSNNLINSSSPPPPTLYRKTSIISNLKMKAEKNSNLKKLSGLMKSDNNAVNATENKTGILKTVQKNATIAPKFRSNSIFNPNIKATMEEKRKSSFIEKEKSLVIEDPDLALIDILRVLKKVN